MTTKNKSEKELFNKQTEYLLKDISEIVRLKHKKGWTYSQNKPIQEITEIVKSIRKVGNLAQVERKLDEIISVCVVWKHGFIEWEEIDKEEIIK